MPSPVCKIQRDYSPVCELVENPFVRVFLAPEKNEVFERVRQAIVAVVNPCFAESLGGHGCIQVTHGAISGDQGDLNIVQIEVKGRLLRRTGHTSISTCSFVDFDFAKVTGVPCAVKVGNTSKRDDINFFVAHFDFHLSETLLKSVQASDNFAATEFYL